METDTSTLEKKGTMAKKDEDPCKTKNVKCKTLIIDGGKYRTTLTKKYENRQKWIKHNDKLVHSFIPGTIKDLFVEEGTSVKKGDKLMILEAMKMLNEITAPISGKIKNVNIEIGSSIPKGTLMIEFE